MIISQRKCSFLMDTASSSGFLSHLQKYPILGGWRTLDPATSVRESRERRGGSVKKRGLFEEEAVLFPPPLLVLGLSRYNPGVNVGGVALTLIWINLVHQLWQICCTNFELS
jgi:hypothetical protein